MIQLKKSTFIKLGFLTALSLSSSSAVADEMSIADGTPASIQPNQASLEGDVIINREPDCAACRAGIQDSISTQTSMQPFGLESGFFKQLAGGNAPIPVTRAPLATETETSAEVAKRQNIFFNQRTQNRPSLMAFPDTSKSQWEFALPGSIGESPKTETYLQPVIDRALLTMKNTPLPPMISFEATNQIYQTGSAKKRDALVRSWKQTYGVSTEEKVKKPARRKPANGDQFT